MCLMNKAAMKLKCQRTAFGDAIIKHMGSSSTSVEHKPALQLARA
jgi:hypothetical protein